MFNVQGVSRDYVIEIHEDSDLWPPRCDCEGNYYRPDLLCKHIVLVLALLGVEDHNLEDCAWEPEQEELYELLGNAPSCVGCTMSENHIINKGTSCN